jgi:hypothetical protein
MLLYSLLRSAFGKSWTVCSDQFVYFDAEDPKQCLAPDAFVRRVVQTEFVRSWKVWERGAPELAVEIVSDSDEVDLPWERKMARYRQLGVSELVRFHPESEQRALRVWDRVQGTLVEREVSNERARSLILPIEWVVAPADDLLRALRFERDGELVWTDQEALQAARAATEATRASTDAARAAREAERVAKEAERAAREAAEARVRELEAELRRR